MILPNPIETAREYVTESADYAFTTRQNGNLEISYKQGDVNNVLTHVDLANSERAKVIFKPFLDAGEILIDEENLPSLLPEAIFALHKPLWIIDPIDGTRPFSLGEDSWGVMLARVVAGKVTYANINMPSVGQRLELYPEGGTVVLSQGSSAIARTLPTGKGSVVHISKRVEGMRKLVSEVDLNNVYVPSAAEVTINMALGHCALAALPSKAGLWDIAPIMMLAEINGYSAFFESDPHNLLTLDAAMFLPNWQLRDNLVVTSPEMHGHLYGMPQRQALQASR